MNKRNRKVAVIAGVIALIVAMIVAFTSQAANAVTCSQLLVSGHRGITVPSGQPTNENTYLAFSQAYAAGANAIETDLRHIVNDTGNQTVTGFSVIQHDPDWTRNISPSSLAAAGLSGTTLVNQSPTSKVYQLTTTGGQPIASLNDVFQAVADARFHSPVCASCVAYIEVKDTFSAAEVTKILNLAYSAYNLDPSWVTFYGTWSLVQPFGTAGAKVGVSQTSVSAQSFYVTNHITYVQGALGSLDATEIGKLHGYGVPVVSTDGLAVNHTQYQQAKDAGFDRILVNNPSDAILWRGNACV